MLVPTNNPKFGDYQANLAMSLAKPLKQKPRDIATQIVENWMSAISANRPKLQGPGFINLRLKTEYLEAQLRPCRLRAAGGGPSQASPDR
jgi:arginyl-tRNA synthetase